MVNLHTYKPRTWHRLARPTDLRMSLLKTMASQLVEHERILTTLNRAHALQRYADSVIATAKKGTRAAYSKAAGIMRTDAELHKLFTTLALRYRDRPGGFTRVVKAGFRHHDAAPMAYVELVDREGELRQAAHVPVSPLLPPAARAFVLASAREQQQASEAAQKRGLPVQQHMWQARLQEWRRIRQETLPEGGPTKPQPS